MSKHLKVPHLEIGTYVWMKVHKETSAAKALVIGWDPYDNPRRCCVKLKFSRIDLNGPLGYREICHEAFDTALVRVGS